MKKIIVITAIIGVSLSSLKAQLVTTVDMSFHPIIDTSVHSYSACKVVPFSLSLLSADSVSRIAIKGGTDNFRSYSDIQVLFLSDSLQTLASQWFTLQDDPFNPHLVKNYTDVQYNGVEYLFQVVATYLKNSKHIPITFK